MMSERSHFYYLIIFAARLFTRRPESFHSLSTQKFFLIMSDNEIVFDMKYIY